MTTEEIVTCPWFWMGMTAMGVLALGVGLLSVVSPGRSIGLYQAIMRLCNWRVEPIDAPRELRTTRWLGVLLVALAGLTFWLRSRR